MPQQQALPIDDPRVPPPHGPGCLPTSGRSWRDGGPRYICTDNCPRRRWLARDLDRCRA